MKAIPLSSFIFHLLGSWVSLFGFDLAVLQMDNAIGLLGDHWVMGDEHKGLVQFAIKFAQERDDGP